MSRVFKSEFLNKYFMQVLQKEDFTLEDLKEMDYIPIINEDLEHFIKIGSEDLNILCSLGDKYYEFKGIDFSGVCFPDTNLTDLCFSKCKLATCDFSQLQVNESLSFYDNVELKNNGISQFAHMTQIQSFYCIDCEQLDLSEIKNLNNIKRLEIQGEVKNISSISNLKQLESIKTMGVSEVSSSLPSTDTLEYVEINDPQLVDINFLKKYPNLEQIRLSNSKIDSNQLDSLCELKKRRISVIFDETKFKEQLTESKYGFTGLDEEAVKHLFCLPHNINLNEYELLDYFSKGRLSSLKLTDVKILDELITSGLISNDSVIAKLGVIKHIDFVVENLEDITPNVIEYISQNKDKQFKFVVRTLNGLDSGILDKLSENSNNIEFYVQGDLFHFQEQVKNQIRVDTYKSKHISFSDLEGTLTPYNLEDVREIVSILEIIKEQTVETKDDLEKFSIIRKIKLMSSSYDCSGNRNSKSFELEKQVSTRSLKGFLEGGTVCVGDALGFLMASEYVGLKAKCINGVHNKDKVGHAWNQIRIVNQDGIANWYNYDNTNDSENGDYSLHILQSDEKFYENCTPFENEDVEKCYLDILSNDSIYEASLKNFFKEKDLFGDTIESAFEGQYSGKKITPQDVKSILGSLTLSELTYFTEILQQVVKQPKVNIAERQL